MNQTIPNESQRIVWVDLCRILCIFIVLVPHSYIFLSADTPWHGILLSSSYTMTRPIVPVLIFFFFSGWLQKPRARYLEWKKTFFYFLPAILFWNCAQVIVQSQYNQNWLEIISRIGIWKRYPLNEPLWFLIELSWYTLLLPLIHRIPIHCRVFLVIILLWFGHCHFSKNAWGYTNNISFFLAGTIAHNLDRNVVCNFFKKTAIYFFPVSAYIFYNSLIPCVPHYNLPSIVTHNAFTPIVGMMTIFAAAILLENILPKYTKKLANYAPGVFFIYASHWPIFCAYKMVADKFDIPNLPPKLFPLNHITFMILGFFIWKIGSKIPNRWIQSVIFLNPVRKTKQANT